MKKMKLLLAALTALAAVATSRAITVSTSDLILGFSSTNAGVTSALEVNLGSASSLIATSAGSEITLGGLAAADLDTFGASGAWKNSQTTWGVAGSAGAGGGNQLWGTVKSGATVGNPGANQGSAGNAVASLYSASAGGLAGQDPTANSASASLVATTLSNGWKTKATASLNFGFASWTNKLVQNTASLASSAFQTSELFSFVQGAAAAIDLGTFRLYDDGHITFQSFQAIPEPSTYAALLGIATLSVVAIRRRRQAALDLA